MLPYSKQKIFNLQEKKEDVWGSKVIIIDNEKISKGFFTIVLANFKVFKMQV